jgi:hypothetical protein
VKNFIRQNHLQLTRIENQVHHLKGIHQQSGVPSLARNPLRGILIQDPIAALAQAEAPFPGLERAPSHTQLLMTLKP